MTVMSGYAIIQKSTRGTLLMYTFLIIVGTVLGMALLVGLGALIVLCAIGNAFSR